MSKQIITITGNAFHVPGNDLDTDRIIPARFLKCITFEGLGAHAFEDARKQQKGAHPFDLFNGKERSILVVDANFGCGSSREHAVAAIQDFDIQAIIGRSFGEIFRGNATANGIPCVELDEASHGKFVALVAGARNITVNLQDMMLSCFDGTENNFTISMPSTDRDMLVKGEWDTIDTLLAAGDEIEKTAAKLPYMRAEAA